MNIEDAPTPSEGLADARTPECDGICVTSADIGFPGYGIAYPHPGCPLHAPGQSCDCGQRMCMDCGGPWCDVCVERVPSIPWADGMVCDTCHVHLVRFGLTADESPEGVSR